MRSRTPPEALREVAVVIAGAGIAGSALFYELSRRGVEVLLLDSAAQPAGASSIPAALVNPHRGRTARARTLDLEGLASFWRLTAELRAAGHDPGARASGVLRIASNARQARGWQRLESEAGGGLAWLEPGEAPSPYHAPFGGLLVRRGGWLEPATLLTTLRAAGTAAGGQVAFGHELRGWRASGSGLSLDVYKAADGIHGELAAAVHTKELVLCLGAYDPVASRLPRLQAETGLALTLPWPPSIRGTSQPGQVPPLAGAVGLIPRGHDLVLTGAALPGAIPHQDELKDAARNLLATSSWYLPGLSEATPTSAWHGVRVRRRSGTPVVRRLDEGVTLFAGLAGRGFLTGPLLAERLAERLTERVGASA